MSIPFGNSSYIQQVEENEEEIIGIENEGNSFESSIDYPYNTDDIRIDSKVFSVFQIYTWINNGTLILRPDFQRKFVWSLEQQSLLIESLMLKIPIPVFYFSENEQSEKIVIDGMQRLTTIYRFMEKEFQLKGLQYLTNYNGKSFDQLEKKYKNRIEETQLSVNVLDAKCPPEVKFDVFRRINTGGVPLNAQEIRNIMSGEKVRVLLGKMAESDSFLIATHRRVNDIRMNAQELCLRFIACYERYNSKTGEFETYDDMTRLLDVTILKLNTLPDKKLMDYFLKFEKSMKNCYELFGDNCFTKPGKKIINRALFTSFAVVLADVMEKDVLTLRGHRQEACDWLIKTLTDRTEYYNAITSSTSAKINQKLQFRYARQLVEDII